MSFLGKLFGTEAATKEVVGAVKSGLDAMWYTEEEKATDAAAARQEGQRFIIEWLKSTTGSRLARRLIALIVTSVWTLQFLTAQLFSILAVWVDEPERYEKTAQVVSDNIGQSTGAMMLVLGFYFAAPHMGDIAKAALVKFGRNKNETRD